MSTLPTELVTEILRLSLPSPLSRFVSSTYQDRVSLLSNFSLACHAFNQIAEPFLYSFFWARNVRQFDAFIEAVHSRNNAHRVERLIIDGRSGGFPLTRAWVAADALTSVKELSLYQVSLTHLKVLNGFTKLEYLTLERVSHGKTNVFTIPSLRQLTVGHKCDIDLKLMNYDNAPQLTGLALRHKTNLGDWNPGLSTNTPWGLNALVLDWYKKYGRDPSQRFPNVLINISSSDLYIDWSEIFHSGFVHFRTPDFELIPFNIKLLVEFVRKKSGAIHRLETLIVPPRFGPDFESLNDEVWRGMHGMLKILSDKCIAKGVDLIYEDALDHVFDSDVSKAFLEKMERLARARQEAETSRKEEEDVSE
ncbi:uncharacterized protein JCM6883_007235 [Sporobolomyces salmoneus]|uniref:uncharacterized protein n=1 Tax=Sporobolomyces salmoneus TaxID=183962 RepID=UPI003178BB5B